MGLAIVALVKISESSLSAVIVLSLKSAYGMLVCGCCNAYVSSKAARVAVSAYDKLGILNYFGKNFTVSHTPCCCFFCYIYFPAPVMV